MGWESVYLLRCTCCIDQHGRSCKCYEVFAVPFSTQARRDDGRESHAKFIIELAGPQKGGVGGQVMVGLAVSLNAG